MTLARLVAALAIVCASVAVTPVADAQPRGERGRGHQSQRHRRGRSRGGYHDRDNYNPIPGILGGIFGGWLAGKAQQDEEEDGHGAMKNRLK